MVGEIVGCSMMACKVFVVLALVVNLRFALPRMRSAGTKEQKSSAMNAREYLELNIPEYPFGNA